MINNTSVFVLRIKRNYCHRLYKFFQDVCLFMCLFYLVNVSIIPATLKLLLLFLHTLTETTILAAVMLVFGIKSTFLKNDLNRK